jgi:hypothetical protein
MAIAPRGRHQPPAGSSPYWPLWVGRSPSAHGGFGSLREARRLLADESNWCQHHAVHPDGRGAVGYRFHAANLRRLSGRDLGKAEVRGLAWTGSMMHRSQGAA